MVKRTLFILLPVLFFLDIGYSFYQHRATAMDGDMAAIILPADWYRPVLEDPFGTAVLIDQASYGGTGRYFCHMAMSMYYKSVPIFLQQFMSPIDSVYCSTALLKILVQVLLISLLAVFISDSGKWRYFFLATVLVFPLFQTFGYNIYMGLIEKSPTYFFFYSLPLALLFLYFYLVYKNQNRLFNVFIWVLVLVLPFSGPLIPALAMLICPILIVSNIPMLVKWLPQPFRGFVEGISAISFMKQVSLFVLLLLAVYSFYLSRFNVDANVVEVGMTKRYLALLTGIYKQLTQKIGLPLLIGFIGLNYVLLGKSRTSDHLQVRRMIQCLALMSLIYLLLLPLGGYRGYRSLIVRHDTMMPVTLAWVYMFGCSTFSLLKNQSNTVHKAYQAGVILILLIFSFADLPNFHHNACERSALHQISQSEASPLKLNSSCTIMAWGKTSDPDDAWLNMRLLELWRVVPPSERLYFQTD